MKIVIVLLIVLGLVVAIFPQFYTCEAHGFDIELRTGVHIPMVCKWTAHAEFTLGLLLLTAGILSVFLRSRETRLALSVMAILLGIFILGAPQGHMVGQESLISYGICVNPDMPCVVIMKPALDILGPLVIATGIAGVVLNKIRLKPTA